MLYDDLIGPQGTWLCHHGVKGQKWGVRHDKEKVGGFFARRKAKREEQMARNKELAKKIEKQTPTIMDIAGLPWTLDKYGNFNTYASEVPISIHKTRVNNTEDRQTVDALLKNMDKVANACNTAHSRYISNRGINFDEDHYTWSAPDNYTINGNSVIAEYLHDYGVVSAEMNPRTLQVYNCWYDD